MVINLRSLLIFRKIPLKVGKFLCFLDFLLLQLSQLSYVVTKWLERPLVSLGRDTICCTFIRSKWQLHKILFHRTLQSTLVLLVGVFI